MRYRTSGAPYIVGIELVVHYPPTGGVRNARLAALLLFSKAAALTSASGETNESAPNTFFNGRWVSPRVNFLRVSPVSLQATHLLRSILMH